MNKVECEGGCGVIGVACAEKVAAKHLLEPLICMKNRGNGKGGGIAAAGLCPEDFGVTQNILDNDFLLAIAYLDPTVQPELEKRFIHPLFEVDHVHTMKASSDVAKVMIYFVRLKADDDDELVYQNSYQLNLAYYAAIGEKRAFVLSHGKDLLVLKCVGFAEDVIKAYQIEEMTAHIWIGHHRYPTKGRVWHPGGAHPFIGLHEALVHNGDFANYSAICEYLAQRDIHPLYLTDTEVAALLFDLLHRRYQYPLEYVLEALAPTTERDFYKLPKEKQDIYKLIQTTHLQASPDGPWFFIIAQSHKNLLRLIGITDTSMLRPQVFAMQLGASPIGLIASEKQAVDVYLESLSAKKNHFWPRADYYWSCRGGSHTDGGAFIFTVEKKSEGKTAFTCHDKFGKPLDTSELNPPSLWGSIPAASTFPDIPGPELYTWAKEKALTWSHEEGQSFLTSLCATSPSERTLYVLTKLIDHIYPLKKMRRSFFLALVEQSLSKFIQSRTQNEIIYLDGHAFPVDGKNSLAREIVNQYKAGFKKFVVGNCRGHRFIGNGLGPSSHGVEIDVYGSSGDYLASGIDGAVIRVHNSAQDQIAQIMKDGKLVVYGDVGQTFLYGAKGGVAYVRGNAAGRPLINAVGSAKLIINGTCLDYLAESFMAGEPLKAGGFALVNSIAFNDFGELVDLPTPYPGNNLLSLASGGAIYVRDPKKLLSDTQLNGGKFADITPEDENLIVPYLEENELLFDIPISRLLQERTFKETYRKIIPYPTHFIDPEKAWVTSKNGFKPT